PICFASRTLSETERRYSQLNKEALAIVFAVQKFYSYLCGTTFTIYTDHQPLLGIFNPKKPIPQMVSPRLMRWCIILASFNYTLQYRQGSKNGNADTLSRLPIPVQHAETLYPAEVFLLREDIGDFPITNQHIREWTNGDKLLTEVRRSVHTGEWDRPEDPKIVPFYRRRLEL